MAQRIIWDSGPSNGGYLDEVKDRRPGSPWTRDARLHCAAPSSRRQSRGRRDVNNPHPRSLKTLFTQFGVQGAGLILALGAHLSAVASTGKGRSEMDRS